MFKFLLLIIIAYLHAANSMQQKKDVLFIAVDDLRPELGVYGFNDIKSPNIDALAAKSMVFERAYCQVAVCSPSRASLLTGRRPDTNHVWRIYVYEYWRNFTNATTIPQYFKENGYVSVGMGKVFHPGPMSGNDDVKYSWSLPYFRANNTARSPTPVSWYRFENISDDDLKDGKIADNAVKVLQQIKQNRTKGDNTPFFVAVGFHKPHLPFFAPSRFYDMYPQAEDIKLPSNPDAPKNIPLISWSTSAELRHFKDMQEYNQSECYSDFKASSGKNCTVTKNDSRLLRRGYYAAISFTDALIGRVLQELEKQGLADNTIIVLWGDHGWKLGEHNMWTKHTNFEDDTHVPFMLRVPGVTDSGMRSKALVELIDIFPTLTELAGLNTPPLCPENNKNLLACVEGSSVVPLLKNPDQRWKKAIFSQYPRPYDGLSSIPGKPPFTRLNRKEDVMGYAMRVDQYRFVEWYTFDREVGIPNFEKVWGTELYDHTQPTVFFNDENTNMANDADKQELVKELRKMLQDGWRAVIPTSEV